MKRFVSITSVLLSILLFFTFFNYQAATPSLQVKTHYNKQATVFTMQTQSLLHAVEKGNSLQIQQEFFRCRNTYKQIEVFVEYFHAFQAAKLNGPPIPFFEEDEPDVLQHEPTGMQVIESLIFPSLKKSDIKVLLYQAAELHRYAKEMLTMNTSFAFDDANIFDAFMEQVYRITAMGITGFDTQVAQNTLAECTAALNGLQQFLIFYKKDFNVWQEGSYATLEKNLVTAQLFIKKAGTANALNRMELITQYLNPIALSIGNYKAAKEFPDNKSGRYYSGITKYNTLFAPDIFKPGRFLDDYSTSPEKVALGKMLFYETALSVNNSRSCASCHQPEKAFTDGLRVSTALDGHSPLPRNAPTLLNAALQRNLFLDSRTRNLEDQVMAVLNNAFEMNGNAQAAAEKIVAQEKYKDTYQKVYAKNNTAAAATNICNAIACYERTLIALNSRFDKHMSGKKNLTATEISGFNLFMGKAKCGTCHFMPLFGGSKPPRYYYTESEVIGVPATNNTKPFTLDKDSGRYHATNSPLHLFAFKTPTLRNITLTAPYMHNGVFNTLDEVMDFYNKGGGTGIGIAPLNQTLPTEKLELTLKERKEIIAFMKTLTDTIIVK
jgi:cytochrome c peroxidase